MGFRQATRKIIEDVEQVSGYRVHVYKDTSLQIPATVRMARGTAPYHIVIYNPASATNPDYLICYECGFILRLYSLPKGSRKVFAVIENAEVNVATQMKKEVNLPESVLHQLTSRYFEGILTQLRSIPIGLRVDRYIRSNYPELIDLQEIFVRNELKKNAQVLNPEIKKLAPAHIYNCNVAMNAAYATFWSKILNDPKIALTYDHVCQKKLANDLLDILERNPDQPENDMELVNQWASVLGLSDWYKWVNISID